MLNRPWLGLARSGHDPLRSALGRLEREVMEVVWSAPHQSVREVQGRLGRSVAYTTVMTTLDRLFKKRLVERQMVGRAFLYRATRSRQELTADLTTGLVQGVLAGGSEAARPFLSNLVEAVGAGDAALLDELERLVRERRQQVQAEAGDDRGGEAEAADPFRTET